MQNSSSCKVDINLPNDLSHVFSGLLDRIDKAQKEHEANGIDFILLTPYVFAEHGRYVRQKHEGKWYAVMRKETLLPLIQNIPPSEFTFGIAGIPILEDDELGKKLLLEFAKSIRRNLDGPHNRVFLPTRNRIEHMDMA